ncbi:MAG TPA: DUF3168 domain-containing protein [Gemmatimonadaceae bacterium]|nr:DUF3168 domain-containing protein [Gemmatimonadaceae bacterium]
MSASAADSAVQAAIYVLLSGDATLAGLTDHIGDSVPQGAAAKRYVIISITSETRDRRLSDTGGNAAQLLVSISSHVEDSQAQQGNKAVQAINRRVVELLDNAELVVVGWQFVSCDFSDSVAQRDGAWRSITSDFDVLVEDL